MLKSGKSDDEILEELFLATLSRPPKKGELEVIKGDLGRAENRAEFLRDLFWALLNSKEYAFNH